MTLAEEIEKINPMSEADIKNLSLVLLHSVRISQNSSTRFLKCQEDIVSDFISLLGKFMNENILDNSQKLLVVKLLDKMNLQKELIELRSQGLSIDDLKIAAERLGKKSQSAF